MNLSDFHRSSEVINGLSQIREHEHRLRLTRSRFGSLDSNLRWSAEGSVSDRS